MGSDGQAGVLYAFRDVGLVVGGHPVLRHVTVDLADRGVTVVVGRSGSGKSTLLRCCNRLEVPTSGTVSLRGADLATVDPLRLRRRCAMVFQRPVVFAGTVFDNLRAADPTLDRAGASTLLGRAGLDLDLVDRVADTLSGGEAQRLVVARALATGPEIVLADEATSALDATATRRLERLVRDLADDGLPVVWVTHDLDQARRLADHLVVMTAGTVSWSGTPGTEASRAAVAEALADPDGEGPDLGRSTAGGGGSDGDGVGSHGGPR